jgi:hypothetical protein
MFSVYNPEKWYLSVQLLETAAEWKTPAVLFLGLSSSGAMRPCRRVLAGRFLVDLVEHRNIVLQHS